LGLADILKSEGEVSFTLMSDLTAFGAAIRAGEGLGPLANDSTHEFFSRGMLLGDPLWNQRSPGRIGGLYLH
jgi:hypothetical protein